MPNLNIRHLQLFFKQITKEAETPTKTGGTTLKRSKKLQNPDFQTKSGFSLFAGSAKNSGFRHLLVEQSVEMKTTPFISTEFVHFSLNFNILHDAKSGRISYICRTS